MLDRLVLLSLLVLSCQRPSIGAPQHAGPVAGDPAGTEHESSNAAATSGSQGDAQNRILNLFDAFGPNVPGTQKAFGFSALVHYEGKTILFDAGSSADVLEANARALGVD